MARHSPPFAKKGIIVEVPDPWTFLIKNTMQSIKRKLKRDLTPRIKVAVMIDGGYFVKRFNSLFNEDKSMSGEEVAECLYRLAHRHFRKTDYLYRIFYYDCLPFDKKHHYPISNRAVDFSKSPAYRFRVELINALKRKRKLALRMGKLKEGGWRIRPERLKSLLRKEISFESLTDEDMYLELRQKGIDMKIGIDIASLSFNMLVDKIVLFSGDSDFVPASKLARREGIDFVLDPMQGHIEQDLFEHIDGVSESTKNFTPKRKQ